MFSPAAVRSIISSQDKNYLVPEGLNDIISHLDKTRPIYSLFYFTAAWNPVIKHIEKDYENTTKLFKQYAHYRVDCDKQPLVKQYFDARVEPQFLILLNGGELRRVIGYNFERLHGFLEEATVLHEKDFHYYGNSKNTWERFYDNYDRFSRTGDHDKDSFKIFYETLNDQHRGVGTENP